MKGPKLSVILSAYNSEKYINEAINSILKQSFIDFELLIADDGSTDNTRRIIDSFVDDRISCFHNNTNCGKVDTVNKLLGLVNGKFITVHDADDISLPDRFEKQIAFLLDHPNCKMIGCSFFKLYGKKRTSVIMPSSYESICRMLPEVSQFHGPTVMFNGDILESVGGLYRYFTWGEDIDFTARVVEKHNATNLSEPLYIYRIHKDSLTKSVDKISPKRLINRQLRCRLAKQRKDTGTDILMQNDFSALQDLECQLMEPFKEDSSLVYWQLSQNLYIEGMKASAIKAAWVAFVKKASLKNAKNVAYMCWHYFKK